MHIDINATNMDLTPAIRAAVETKIGSLDKFVDPQDTSVRAAVDVGLTTRSHQHGEVFYAEVNLHTAAHDFYVTEEDEDLYVAIDKVRDVVSRDLRRTSRKKEHLLKKGGRTIKNMLRGIE